MRPDLHINQKNTQTSLEDFLQKGLKPCVDKGGFYTKVLHHKEVTVAKGVFFV